MLIDAHLHLPVVSEQRTYEEAKRILLADLERDQVDHAILIPDNVPGSPIGDVDTCLKLIEGEAKLSLMGTIDIQCQGREWLDTLEKLITQRKIVGMKIFPGHDPIYPTDPRLSPVYALCAAHRIPMVIHTGWNSNHPEAAQYNDPKYVVEVAQTYPVLNIVIAHFFWPELDYCYELTHGHANICYDTSALADEEVVRITGLERIRGVLMKVLAQDPERVIFGTDYAMCSRPRHIALIDGLPLQPEVRENVFWRNAARLFNLGTTPRWQYRKRG